MKLQGPEDGQWHTYKAYDEVNGEIVEFTRHELYGANYAAFLEGDEWPRGYGWTLTIQRRDTAMKDLGVAKKLGAELLAILDPRNQPTVV